MRKVITMPAPHYIVVESGKKYSLDSLEILAWVRYVRSDADSAYLAYGDDADTYEEFERDGFVKSKVCSSYEEAEKWLKEMEVA